MGGVGVCGRVDGRDTSLFLTLSPTGRQGHFVSVGRRRWQGSSQDGGGTGTICFRRAMVTLTDVLRPRHSLRRPLTSASDYSFAPLRLPGALFGKIQVRKEPFDVLMGSIVRGRKRFAAATG